jgi:intein-encoded DNA endonuclease-like protein
MLSFKEQCIKLRKEDKTLNEIVTITGRSKTSVYFHIKNISLSARKQREISQNVRLQAKRVAANRKGKALRPHKTFKKWTPALVLLVAHLMFDGEILKRKCVYHNRSRMLTDRVERLMCEVYDFPPTVSIDKKSGVRRVSYHNVALANYLFEKAIEIKSSIANWSSDHQREYIRAFFDDEGCMDFRIQRNIRSVRGYQKDRKTLTLLCDLLENFNIKARVREPNEIVIYGKENLLRFQKEINFSEGVRLNPQRANSIWKKPIEKRVLLDLAIKSFKT